VARNPVVLGIAGLEAEPGDHICALFSGERERDQILIPFLRAGLTWDKRLRELTRPAVLILDDFGVRELTAAQADDLYELITERAGRSLILTSDRAPADWYPLFPNPVVAESLLDRLINTSHQVFMNGPSYRPNKRPGRITPTPKEDIRLKRA
jgi:DNA replication protein DnaC